VSTAREPDLRADGVEAPVDRAPRSPGPEDTAPARPRSGIVIGRYQATVVVTVHGELDRARAAHLGLILADLIDGQGNLSLLVDLHHATAADASPVSVFADADERARRRGGSIALSKPPALLLDALHRRGLGHLVDAVVQHGAKAPPGAEGSSRRERAAHPTGGSPPLLSGGSCR
jgi:anti-anti-sigma factor